MNKSCLTSCNIYNILKKFLIYNIKISKNDENIKLEKFCQQLFGDELIVHIHSGSVSLICISIYNLDIIEMNFTYEIYKNNNDELTDFESFIKEKFDIPENTLEKILYEFI